MNHLEATGSQHRRDAGSKFARAKGIAIVVSSVLVFAGSVLWIVNAPREWRGRVAAWCIVVLVYHVYLAYRILVMARGKGSGAR